MLLVWGAHFENHCLRATTVMCTETPGEVEQLQILIEVSRGKRTWRRV